MSVDQRLVGFWNHTSVTDGTFFEITPAGRYFIHENHFSYEISRDGTKLIMHASSEKVVYHRQGHPSATLTGAWSHTYPDYGETETFIFNEDGSYVNTWDDRDYSVGFYIDHTHSLQIIEYRGSVSTDETIYRLMAAPDDIYEYRFEFAEEATFRLYDKDTGQLESIYNKKTA